MRRRAVVALGACLFCAPSTLALDSSLDISQYGHGSWKIRDGFTRGVISSITQTPDGYLWLGTEFGLLRFDGVRAAPWKPPGGEQLPSDYIRALLTSRDGTLWIASQKGLSSWAHGKLTNYSDIPGEIAGVLLEDRQGTIWFAANAPGRVCTIRGGEARCYGTGSFGLNVIALCEDSKGNLWILADTGLWRWTPGGSEHYTLPGRGTKVDALIAGDNGALVMDTNEGLKELVDGETRSYALPRAAPRDRPNVLFRSTDGGLWIGTVQGLLHLHSSPSSGWGRIDKFGIADGLSGGDIRSIFEDREGDVWVSTRDGLDRFREVAVGTISVDQGLSNPTAWAVESTPDGAIWIATADGLNRLANGHVTVYGSRNAHRGLPSTALSLAKDNRGRLWASTREGVFSFEQGRFVRVPGVAGGDLFPIAVDGQGKAWISNGEARLFSLSPAGGVQQFALTPFAKFRVSALLPDRSQGVWLGFVQGGIAYFKDGQVRASYDSANGLGSGRLEDLEPGSDGAVWAATEGGLSRVRDGRITTLTSKNGLPCDSVQWVMEDHDHSFWLYTACGLVRIAGSDLEAWIRDPGRIVRPVIFDESDGVGIRAQSSTHAPRVTESPDGKIWFLPRGGVSVIDPRQLPFNPRPPPVYIEEVIADGKKYDATRGLRLPARVRDVVVDYTALSLAAPQKVHFRFRLEGQDPDWREVVNQRRVEYSNLPPGDYRFRVMACNNNGVWNEAGDTLDFSIEPAYYQTNRFRALCVIALAAALWSLYRLRLRQIGRELNANLEGRVGERVRIARNLHDTLLQTVQGLMLRLQVVQAMLPPGTAKEDLEEIMEIGDRAIVEGRDTVNDLRSQVTARLAPALHALGDELANGSGATFRVVVEGAARDLHPILRDELYRIAREALRNAFAHARAQNIEVEIAYGEQMLRLRIRDDGEGIPAEILTQGRAGHFGLAGMRERARQIGAKLTIWSRCGAGAEIELSVPDSIAYRKAGRARFRLFGKKAG